MISAAWLSGRAKGPLAVAVGAANTHDSQVPIPLVQVEVDVVTPDELKRWSSCSGIAPSDGKR
jgi:hypothetical protein